MKYTQAERKENRDRFDAITRTIIVGITTEIYEGKSCTKIADKIMETLKQRGYHSHRNLW